MNTYIQGRIMMGGGELEQARGRFLWHGIRCAMAGVVLYVPGPQVKSPAPGLSQGQRVIGLAMDSADPSAFQVNLRRLSTAFLVASAVLLSIGACPLVARFSHAKQFGYRGELNDPEEDLVSSRLQGLTRHKELRWLVGENFNWPEHPPDS